MASPRSTSSSQHHRLPSRNGREIDGIDNDPWPASGVVMATPRDMDLGYIGGEGGREGNLSPAPLLHPQMSEPRTGARGGWAMQHVVPNSNGTGSGGRRKKQQQMQQQQQRPSSHYVDEPERGTGFMPFVPSHKPRRTVVDDWASADVFEDDDDPWHTADELDRDDDGGGNDAWFGRTPTLSLEDALATTVDGDGCSSDDRSGTFRKPISLSDVDVDMDLDARELDMMRHAQRKHHDHLQDRLDSLRDEDVLRGARVKTSKSRSRESTPKHGNVADEGGGDFGGSIGVDPPAAHHHFQRHRPRDPITAVPHHQPTMTATETNTDDSVEREGSHQYSGSSSSGRRNGKGFMRFFGGVVRDCMRIFFELTVVLQ